VKVRWTVKIDGKLRLGAMVTPLAYWVEKGERVRKRWRLMVGELR
jgi:hypothetical protein